MVFTTNCPKDFIPNTPRDNDENGLAILAAVFEENEREEKKNSKQPRTTRKRKLMSPDDVSLVGHDNDDSTSIALPGQQGRTGVTSPLIINEEQQKIGQMACQALVDKYDEHNHIWNTSKAYNPKIAEFKLFYNNDALFSSCTK